jgi:SSS family solute:Na+ symporter
MSNLGTLDWIVIGAYFALLFGILWWVIKQRQSNTEDYFLAGRNVGWFVIGASIFASNIGSEHLVGLAGAGYDTGVVLGHYELHSYIILMLGWIFVPFYSRSKVFTMPEFLEKRYNPTARWFLSLISLIGYVLTKVSVTVYAGGIVIETLTGLNFWTGAFIIVILTGLYTIMGGLRAVVYTETLQTIVLIAGSLAVTTIGLVKLGGWGQLEAIVGSDHLNMWKPLDHPQFPWLGMLFGAPIVGIWYWCTDQYIVQRTLAARDETQARRGTIFAGYLKLLPLFIFIVPGMVAYALVQTGQMDIAASDQALPALVSALLPAGVRGLVAGGLLAALMSSLASVFNSCSTLFTVDIYEKLRPGKSERHLVTVGRIATGIVVALGIAWIPLMQNISGELYQYLQSVQSYIAPPIAAVFLLGVFIKRINGYGALSALIGGFAVGMLRLVLELNKSALSGFWFNFANVNFLYFAIYLLLFSVAVMVVVSLLTPAPDQEKINGLTYSTTALEDKEASRKSWNKWDVINSVVIVGLVIAIFMYFSG